MKKTASVNQMLVIFFAAAVLLSSAATASSADKRGPILSLGFSGSYNDPGWIYRLDPQAGYAFNQYFEADIGLPVYFVRMPDSAIADGLDSRNGIGNAYLDLSFTFERSDYFFSSSVRGTAPTGNTEEGFSTGRATFDWSNYIERSFGSITPFGSIGIANTVSDTHFFNRPFSSLGLVGHFEGGLYYEPLRWLGAAGSVYAVTPTGEQKIYSRISRGPLGGQGSSTGTFPGTLNGTAGQGRGGRGQNRIFEETQVLEGSADLARDHGFSGWIDIVPKPNVAFELGYSRSVSYDYNSIFFSVRFYLSRMVRRNR